MIKLRCRDKKGNFLSRFGWVIFPGGIAVDPDGGIWVTESGKNQIWKYDRSLEVEFLINEDDIPGGIETPYGICISPSGKIYIADTINHRIIILDQFGKFDMAWGEYGKGPGQFMAPVGLTIDSKGRVYVSETWGDRIQIFAPNGEYLYAWGNGGTGPGNFSDITELSLDGDYFLYASDYGIQQGLVHKFALVPDFDIQGKPEFTLGEDMGFFVWSDDGHIWHIRWTGDGIVHNFGGIIHSTSPIVEVDYIYNDSDNDIFSKSTHFVNFTTKESNGADGVDMTVEADGIITFDFRIDSMTVPNLVRVGSNENIPTCFPFPLKTQAANLFSHVGRPEYTAAQDAGYFLWQDEYDGEWHLRWSGDSVKTSYYTGTLGSSERYINIEEYSLEDNDDIEIGNTVISFSCYAGAGEDGIDFCLPQESMIAFDLHVGGVAQVNAVYIGGSSEMPGSIPFILYSRNGSWDMDVDSDVDGLDLSYFVENVKAIALLPQFSSRFGK